MTEPPLIAWSNWIRPPAVIVRLLTVSMFTSAMKLLPVVMNAVLAKTVPGLPAGELMCRDEVAGGENEFAGRQRRRQPFIREV